MRARAWSIILGVFYCFVSVSYVRKSDKSILCIEALVYSTRTDDDTFVVCAEAVGLWFLLPGLRVERTVDEMYQCPCCLTA